MNPTPAPTSRRKCAITIGHARLVRVKNEPEQQAHRDVAEEPAPPLIQVVAPAQQRARADRGDLGEPELPQPRDEVRDDHDLLEQRGLGGGHHEHRDRPPVAERRHRDDEPVHAERDRSQVQADARRPRRPGTAASPANEVLAAGPTAARSPRAPRRCGARGRRPATPARARTAMPKICRASVRALVDGDDRHAAQRRLEQAEDREDRAREQRERQDDDDLFGQRPGRERGRRHPLVGPHGQSLRPCLAIGGNAPAAGADDATGCADGRAGITSRRCTAPATARPRARARRRRSPPRRTAARERSRSPSRPTSRSRPGCSRRRATAGPVVNVMLGSSPDATCGVKPSKLPFSAK